MPSPDHPTASPPRRLARHATGALSLLLVVGCAAQKPQQRVQHILLAPVTIKSKQTAAGPRAYVLDFGVLNDEAMAHYDAGRWARAVENFDVILDEFPENDGVGAVAFNCGLSLLRLGRPLDAARRFRDAIRHGQGSRDARDAVFLLAESLELAGRHKAAANVYKAVVHDTTVERIVGGKLGLLDGLEATARWGLALKASGDIHAAEKALREVERIYENHREIKLVEQSEWVVRSYHERGEIYRELFETIRFRLPVERMQKDLEDKANLFLKAQAAYFRAIRLHSAKWSLAAGYRIGGLYARLIDDIYAAEIPVDLSAEMVEVYREELYKHTGHLAKRAVTILRKNIELAQRMGVGGDWVEKSKVEMARMEALLAKEERAAKRRASGDRPQNAEKPKNAEKPSNAATPAGAEHGAKPK